MLSLAVAVSAASFSAPVAADDVKMVGVITKIKMASDGKSAVATLKDNKSGDSVTININDDLTLDKFKDKRIVEGDEIRAKYDNAGGRARASLSRRPRVADLGQAVGVPAGAAPGEPPLHRSDPEAPACPGHRSRNCDGKIYTERQGGRKVCMN
jgi:hypothetical protein